MRKKGIFLATALSITLSFAIAQSENVGIGTQNPNESAILELNSENKGFLPPRLTTAQRDAIISPAPGLMVYNTDDGCLDTYGGSSWHKNCPGNIDPVNPGMEVSSVDSLVNCENSWTQKGDFPGSTRHGAVSFTINNKAYVGSGWEGGGMNQDFWEYDPLTELWSPIADFPGSARGGAVAFVINNKAYVATGESANGLEKDVWEYDPATDNWVQKNDFGGVARKGAVAFVLYNTAYLLTGLGQYNGLNDFWEYDAATDTWIQLPDFSGEPRFFAVSFTLNGKGYVGTGGEHHDLWEYNPNTQSWTQKADIGDEGRRGAVAFTLYNKAYISTGELKESGYVNDLWEFDPQNNSMVQKADYPTAKRNAVAFSLNNKAYLGTGALDESSFVRDFYEYCWFDGQIFYNYQPPNIIIPTGMFNYLGNVSNGSWIFDNPGDNIYNANGNNVGIGTSNPINKLSVLGDADFTGNVGIGTDEPSSKLDIEGNLEVNGAISMYNTSTSYMDYYTGNNSGHLTVGLVSQTGEGIFWNRKNEKLLFGTNDLPRMEIQNNGNVDIRERLSIGTSNKLYLDGDGGANKIEYVSSCMGEGTDFMMVDFWGCGNEFDFLDFRRGSFGSQFRVTQSGNVYADGLIFCREVEVSLDAFPDYVFEKDYKLMPLKEVEKFIEEHGHLPNVPSAKEVEENGLGLGEMNKLLLEKVEELTLHAIEKEKKMEVLEEKIARLEALLLN